MFNNIKGRMLLVSSALVVVTAVACGGDSGSPNSSAGVDSASSPATTATADRGVNTEIGPAPTATALATAKLNLNSASGAEFQSAIPSFPSNMVREFLEYRPYVSIQQFRREIGKYVSASQVTEWEKYVFVPVDANNSDAETLKQLPGVNDAIAAQLVSARPYASNDAFIARLGSLVSSADANAARSYLKS